MRKLTPDDLFVVIRADRYFYFGENEALGTLDYSKEYEVFAVIQDSSNGVQYYSPYYGGDRVSSCVFGFRHGSKHSVEYTTKEFIESKIALAKLEEM